MSRHRTTLGVLLVAAHCALGPLAAHAGSPTPCVPMPVVRGGFDPTTDRPADSTIQPVHRALTLASLNTAGQSRISDALALWTYERSVDVLLLQEVGDASSDGESFVAALSARLGLWFAYAPAIVIGNGRTQGLAVLSRYPLNDVRVQRLDFFRLRFRSRCRVALAATINTATGSVRLVNVHLDTRINSSDRLLQLAPALDALQTFNGPRIIGGDFNTMNIWWLRTMWPFPYLQQQSAAVRTLMASAGFQTPFTASPPTFRFLGLPFKLDWLFVNDLQPLEWGVDRVRFSDHRGVWLRATQ